MYCKDFGQSHREKMPKRRLLEDFKQALRGWQNSVVCNALACAKLVTRKIAAAVPQRTAACFVQNGVKALQNHPLEGMYLAISAAMPEIGMV